MPAKIILNPYANRWGADKQSPAITRTLDALGYEYELVRTQAPNEATALAAEAVRAGFDPVVAAGGDGTIGEVVGGLLAGGDCASVRLGVLPLGSANDYAVQLGIPTDVNAACHLLANAQHERTLDAGRINGRAFMNDVTIAFGAQVNIEAATIHRLRGSLIYLGGVFKALRRYRQPVITCEWDGGRIGGRIENQPIVLAYVGNGWRTGGVFYLTPQAEQDDGQLDFIYGEAMSRIATLRLLPQTFSGKHIHDRRVHQVRCTRLRMTSRDPLPVLADGEIIYHDAHELDIRVLPRALRVISGAQPGQRPAVSAG